MSKGDIQCKIWMASNMALETVGRLFSENELDLGFAIKEIIVADALLA